MRILIIGTGYVGLVTAAVLASKHHQIVCVDCNEEKILQLKNGNICIKEPNLSSLITSSFNNLKFKSKIDADCKLFDMIIIAVGTPEKSDGSADISNVYQAVDDVLGILDKDLLIVVKSTVPVGTCDDLEEYIQQNTNFSNIEVVSNPEFLSQGTAVHDMLYPSRIVIGVNSTKAEKIMRNLYSCFDAPIVVTSRKSSEMIKYASNCFLALKLSYINEIANFCEKVGANIDEGVSGIGYDKRIGDLFFKAGLGYGGSCLPKDTKALYYQSRLLNMPLQTIKAAIEVNNNQAFVLLAKLKKYYSNNLSQKTIAILGVRFKSNTDDIRESVAVKNIDKLLNLKVKIKIWDCLSANKIKGLYQENITVCDSIDNTIKNADACFVFVAAKEIIEYDISKFATLMETPLLLDGCRCYNPHKMGELGIVYETIGVNTHADLASNKSEL